MEVYVIKEPRADRLAEVLNRLEASGFTIVSVEHLFGHSVVIAQSSAPPSGDFLLLEGGGYMLQEDGSKIIL